MSEKMRNSGFSEEERNEMRKESQIFEINKTLKGLDSKTVNKVYRYILMLKGSSASKVDIPENIRSKLDQELSSRTRSSIGLELVDAIARVYLDKKETGKAIEWFKYGQLQADRIIKDKNADDGNRQECSKKKEQFEDYINHLQQK